MAVCRRFLLPILPLLCGCHVLFGYDPPRDQGSARDQAAPDLAAPRELAVPGERAAPPDLAGDDRGADARADLRADSSTPQAPGAWVLIPAGSFVMGSPVDELCREAFGKETQHTVKLTRGFWMQTTEVLKTDFLAVRGYNPTKLASCLNCPVDNVNWHEAAAYCNALSQAEGLTECYLCGGSGAAVTCSVALAFSAGNAIYDCEGYRLPTEAEWEYAYRAGTGSAFFEGDVAGCTVDPVADAIGWYKQNTSQMRPPAQKKPNGWQLFDLPGNLWEWCHDWGKDDLGASNVTDPVVTSTTAGATQNHAIRGGSWAESAAPMRAAARMFMLPTMHGGTDGFRCVRTK